MAAVGSSGCGYNLFAERTERVSVFRVGLFSNRLVWLGIATELLLLLRIVYVPTFQWIFGTAAFPVSNWLFLLALIPALFPADELRKAVLRWWERRFDPRRLR